jgi:hypothetical protein
MEPEVSLPQTQVPKYPEPARANPYHHMLLPEDPS